MVMKNTIQEKVDLYPSIKAGKKLLRESEVIDLVESVCESEKTFEGFVTRTETKFLYNNLSSEQESKL